MLSIIKSQEFIRYLLTTEGHGDIDAGQSGPGNILEKKKKKVEVEYNRDLVMKVLLLMLIND